MLICTNPSKKLEDNNGKCTCDHESLHHKALLRACLRSSAT